MLRRCTKLKHHRLKLFLFDVANPFDSFASVPVSEYKPLRPPIYYWLLAEQDGYNNEIAFRYCAPATGDVTDPQQFLAQV